MKKHLYLIFLLICTGCPAWAQNIYQQVPKTPDAARCYLFYLHGKIIEDQGVQAVSEKYGPYHYDKILHTLGQNDVVISEPRSRDTDGLAYARKVAAQVDTLLNAGIKPENITVIGASKGAAIAVLVSHLLKKPELKFVLMAICNTDMADFWKENNIKLWGRVLYLYDEKDEIAGSCKNFLDELKSDGLKEYRECALHLGLGHGILYAPLEEWIIPALNWAHQDNQDSERTKKDIEIIARKFTFTAKPSTTAKIMDGRLNDGVYQADTPPSSYGHKGYASVTVKNGQVVQMVFYQQDPITGQYKDENYGHEYGTQFGPDTYAKAQQSVAGGKSYPIKLIETQNLDAIDAVTGATYNLHVFKQAVKAALEKAKKSKS